MPVQTVIKLRRDTAADWTTTDPILAAGELGIETDTNRIKIGDGTTEWTGLQYGPVGDELVIRVKNASNANAIPAGRLVQFAGAAGDTVTAEPAVTDGSVDFHYLIGVTAAEIAAEGFGNVVITGTVTGLTTNSYTAGTLLYADDANPGQLTSTPPSAPSFKEPVAAVTRSGAGTSGQILVRLLIGSSLNDIHDVELGALTTGEVLQYDGAKWVNATIDALPDQSGQSGNYLTTDGTTASWAAVGASGATPTALGTVFGKTSDVFESSVAVGYQSNESGTGGANTSVGSQALQDITSGVANVAVGTNSLASITTQSENTVLGYRAAYASTSLSQSIAIGKWAMRDKSGTGSIAIGLEALSGSGTASYTIAIGQIAAQTVTGQYNIAIGSDSAKLATTMSESIVIGRAAHQMSGTTATGSVVIGHFATGNYAVTGNYNVIIGHLAGNDVSSGGGNVFVGRSAGFGIRTGSNNVMIGNEAGSNTGAINTANKLYIANSNTNTPLIYGEFNNSLLRVNGKLEVTGGLDAVQLIDSKSANYALVSSDAGKLITNSAAITITVEGLVAGEQVDFLQTGADQITFVAGSGVTLSSKDSNLKTAAQGSPASIKCVAANTYWLIGDLGAQLMSPWVFGILGAASGGPVTPPPAGAFDLLATTVLTANTNPVTFNNLDTYSDYKHLQIRATLRNSSTSTSNRDMTFTVNNSTSSIYSAHTLNGQGASATSLSSTSSTSAYIIDAYAGGGSSSGSFNGFIMDILDFSDTNKNTTFRIFTGGVISGEFDVSLISALWQSTNALTSISFNAVGAASAIGCRYSIYGIK